MTIRQMRQQRATERERRAFDTAYTILEASGLRYQSQQIGGLATILLAYADDEIQRAAAVPSPPSET